MSKKPFVFMFLLGFLLAGCASTDVPPTSTPTSTVAEPTVEFLGAYPQPNMSTEAYPSPLIATGIPQDIPVIAPDPEPGKASVSGVVYSYTTNVIVSMTQGYLTLGKGDDQSQLPPLIVGPLEEENDVVFTTDAQGYFEINNVPPGKYYLAIWAPYSYSLMQVSDTDPTYKMLDLKEGTKNPLGLVFISWP